MTGRAFRAIDAPTHARTLRAVARDLCLHTSRSERPRLGEVAPLGKLTKYVETASKPTLPPSPCHRAGVSHKRAVGAPYRSCFASGQCLSAPLLWQMTMHRSVHTYQRRCRVPRRRAERPARPRGYAINDRAGLVFSETSGTLQYWRGFPGAHVMKKPLLAVSSNLRIFHQARARVRMNA